MKTLLRIDASARHRDSHSRELADYYEAGWRRRHEGGRVIRRDLALDPPPHLSQATIDAFGEPEGHCDDTALSDLLIDELRSADDVLISSPLYNMGPPSPLKAYLDHVVRSGHTFRFDADGATGLLAGKTACLVMARGGPVISEIADDFQTPQLRAILGYVGIAAVSVVNLHGTAAGRAHLGPQLDRARRQIDDILAGRALEWIGTFSEDDREQIGALRSGQAEAIAGGDAERYARLCADDVHLMIPGRDLVSGRADFLACERELLADAPLATFEKHPIRIERHGDLAVEVGRQRLAPKETTRCEVFMPLQKYTHVFRRTAEGWRFALLMSNSCE